MDLSVSASGPASGPGAQRTAPGTGGLPAVHTALVCVALPWLVLSAEHGQLTGTGFDGVYHAGRRLLSRCVLRVYGREPVAVQGRSATAGRARFVGVLRTPGDPGPDPGLTVERTRGADGTERITLRSSATRPLRLPVELALGTDLADLGAVAAGSPGPELSAGVHAAGLRWSAPDGRYATVTTTPPPTDALAVAGLLRWDLELAPGAARTIELRIAGDRFAERAAGAAAGPGGQVLAEARAEGDDPRVGELFRSSSDDLRALLLRDRLRPAEVHAAAGVPWRCGPATAESLWAARMALPLGTRLAVGTLRALARTQRDGPGPDRGRIPGPLRDSGPGLPPRCTGIEATLAFPAVLAEAARWGLPEQELAELLPAAERCLDWLRAAVDADGFVPDPGPAGPLRAETQAHAHRAAMLGADLLDLCGRPGGAEWRERARALRERFRREFWLDDLGGGRPAAALLPGGTPLPQLGSWAAHLLDTGLTGAGRTAPGLLDKDRTEQLARLLGGPALDTGWGLRGLGAKEPGHNPFGHRSGAVRVHETAVAVTGLAAAGYEREAASLLKGLLDAAEAFGFRLPEMYAGEQRTSGSVPVPHPAACRPGAVAATAGVQVLAALAGIRPDAPGRTVALHPMRSAPLGAVRLAGLRVAGDPFAVRIGRLGTAIVEEAADGLQLGV
ncbi:MULTISPECIES: glycogen debranching N-terminal domain-containing protein [Streptomyces]|uniref:Glycogen debranching N-terminal domain-containing protein n=1 Tax=Streptomyces solicathayae TaxID=3081768 RepID=A0ABZ0LQ95_9ACTN|nr:glycogen debranching N-terminal domain-containing protein [Streptomyces sp. HUAS YS2]WOX21669.1 glycogen debranching N-terminal domain-containing protein [Streptomyces sp. HUAS YS2]